MFPLLFQPCATRNLDSLCKKKPVGISAQLYLSVVIVTQVANTVLREWLTPVSPKGVVFVETAISAV